MKKNIVAIGLCLSALLMSCGSGSNSISNSSSSTSTSDKDYSNIVVTFSAKKNGIYYDLQKSVAYVLDIDCSNSKALSYNDLKGKFSYDATYLSVVEQGVASEFASNHLIYTIRALEVTPSLTIKHFSIALISFGFDYEIREFDFEDNGVSLPNNDNEIRNNYPTYYEMINNVYYHNFNTNYPGINSSAESLLGIYIYQQSFSSSYNTNYSNYLLDSSYLPKKFSVSIDDTHKLNALYYYDETQNVSKRAPKQKILGLTIQYITTGSTASGSVSSMSFSIFPKENTSSNKLVTAAYTAFEETVLPFFNDYEDQLYKYQYSSNPEIGIFLRKSDNTESIFGLFEDDIYYYYSSCTYIS